MCFTNLYEEDEIVMSISNSDSVFPRERQLWKVFKNRWIVALKYIVDLRVYDHNTEEEFLTEKESICKTFLRRI